MKKEILFWVITSLLFGELVYGGVIFLLSGDYWEYQPIPISAIDSAGFTYGFSLLILIPYLAGAIVLFTLIKSLDFRYKKILFFIIVSILGLYLGGLIHQTQIKNNARNKQKQSHVTQESVQSQFTKDIKVSEFEIQAIPNNFKIYKIMFSITIPSKYVGDSEGGAKIKLSSDYDTDILEERFSYRASEVIDANRQKDNYLSNIRPFFEENGDLVIYISYIINEINNPNYTRHKINVNLKIGPEYRRTNPNYYNLEYINSFVTE